MLTVLHDYAYGLLSDKTVVVAHYEMAVDLGHDLDLRHCFEGRLLRSLLCEESLSFSATTDFG